MFWHLLSEFDQRDIQTAFLKYMSDNPDMPTPSEIRELAQGAENHREYAKILKQEKLIQDHDAMIMARRMERMARPLLQDGGSDGQE